MPLHERLLTQLLHNDPQLTSLTLSNQTLNHYDTKRLSEVLQHNHTLHSLSLYNCQLSGPDTNTLLQTISNLPLSSLNLGKNPFNSQNLSTLFASLSKISTLRSLNLSYLGLHIHLPHLAKFLRHHPELRTLDLTGSKLGDEGAIAISNALKYTHTLRVLTLSENQIHEAGLAAIAKSLEYNHTLSYLNIQNNPLGPFAALSLSCSLDKNISLTDLLYPEKNSPFEQQVTQKLTRNKHLTALVHELQQHSPSINKIATQLCYIKPSLLKLQNLTPSLLALSLAKQLLTLCQNPPCFKTYFDTFTQLPLELIEELNYFGKNLLPNEYHFCFKLYQQIELNDAKLPSDPWLHTLNHSHYKALTAESKKKALCFLKDLRQPDHPQNACIEKIYAYLKQNGIPSLIHPIQRFIRFLGKTAPGSSSPPPTPPSCFLPIQAPVLKRT